MPPDTAPTGDQDRITTTAAGQPSDDLAAEIAYGGGQSENIRVPATAAQRLVDYDPPPMVEQVRWAIEADGDAAIDATRLLLRHAVKCNVRDLCPTCRAIREATDGT